MYMRDHKGNLPADAPVTLSFTSAMVVAVTTLATLYLGLFPNHVLGLVLSAPPSPVAFMK
jgi:hypothetical protein